MFLLRIADYDFKEYLSVYDRAGKIGYSLTPLLGG